MPHWLFLVLAKIPEDKLLDKRIQHCISPVPSFLRGQTAGRNAGVEFFMSRWKHNEPEPAHMPVCSAGFGLIGSLDIPHSSEASGEVPQSINMPALPTETCSMIKYLVITTCYQSKYRQVINGLKYLSLICVHIKIICSISSAVLFDVR